MGGVEENKKTLDDDEDSTPDVVQPQDWTVAQGTLMRNDSIRAI